MLNPLICRCQNSPQKKAVAEAVAEAADAAAGSGGSSKNLGGFEQQLL